MIFQSQELPKDADKNQQNKALLKVIRFYHPGSLSFLKCK